MAKEQNNFLMMNKKVLVVEDEKVLGDLLSRRLEKEELNFKLAVNAEEGFKKAKEMEPDLILLDIILPGISGFELLEKLKTDPETKEIPVIILSNLGQKSEVSKGRELGALDYLVKADFDLDEIIAKIKKTLDK